MKVKVRTFGELISHFGSETVVELETSAKLRDLVHRLAERERFRKGYLGQYRVIGPHLVLLVNGHNIDTLKELDTVLKDGDIVTIFPPVGGG